MDVNDLRSLVTLASLVLFVALLIHTWSRRRAADQHRADLLGAGRHHGEGELRQQAQQGGEDSVHGGSGWGQARS